MQGPIQTIEQFYSEAQPLVDIFNAFSKKHSLQDAAKPDHICYKCESQDSFEHIRALLENESEYVFQSIISGRRIAYIKFKRPIETLLGPIWFLELSDQKPDGSQSNGFDHIEVYPTAMSYKEMVDMLAAHEQVIHVERPHHTTDDVEIGGGFLFRCTQGPLIEKIRDSEMK